MILQVFRTCQTQTINWQVLDVVAIAWVFLRPIPNLCFKDADPLEDMCFQTPKRKRFRNMKIGSIYRTTCRISMLGHWRSRILLLLCTIQEREAAEGVRFIVEEDLGSVVYKAAAELHSTKTPTYIGDLV